jgi:hypothetical protein
MIIHTTFEKRSTGDVRATVTVVDAEDYPTKDIFSREQSHFDSDGTYIGITERDTDSTSFTYPPSEIVHEVEKLIHEVEISLAAWRETQIPEEKVYTI